MVNASLNWASICGLLVFLLGLISAPASLANIFFLLNRRSDNTSQIILLSIYKVCLGILRSIHFSLILIVTNGFFHQSSMIIVVLIDGFNN